MDRLTVLVPETKRTTIDKAVVSTETITFKTKNGKKMTIPRSSLLLLEENAVIYKFPRRKILKGNFKAVEGGLQDKESGLFAAMESVVIAEPATVSTKKTGAKKKKKKKN
jgi:hypothetical protein